MVVSGQEHLGVGVLDISPDGQWLAFSLDETGQEKYNYTNNDNMET
jgi:hypothetical protein